MSTILLNLVQTDAVTLMIDLATIVHLAAMAVGLGSAIFADVTILGRLNQPVLSEQVRVLERAHHVVTLALGFLWISGLALFVIRTGLDPDRMSPKLITKLGTVAMLTGTAILMSRVALPAFASRVGQVPLDGELAWQCRMAFCGSMSLAGWSTALLLGGSTILKQAGPEVFVLAGLIHVVTVTGALCAVVGLRAHKYRGSAAAGFAMTPGAAAA